MALVRDFFKFFLVFILFFLPFYAVGLFANIEFGEFYAFLFSFSISLAAFLASHIFMLRFFRSKRLAKNRRLLNAINNISFLKGFDRAHVLKTEDTYDGLVFFKSWKGEGYLLVSEKLVKKMSDDELRSLILFSLEQLSKTTILKNTGIILFYLMGMPLRFLGQLKGFKLITHFFFIPLAALSHGLYSLNVLRDTNEKEYVSLRNALAKASRANYFNNGIYFDQVLETCSFSQRSDATLYDLIINKNKAIQLYS